MCNGAAGADGTDGSDGSNGSNGLNSLVRITPEAIDANCAAAGNKIESGLDLNANGILDVGEVTSTRYVCNGTDGADGADGTDGSSNLLRATNAAWGGVCIYGGVKLETGVDTNANGVLDTTEVTQTQYVCNRTAVFVSIKVGGSHSCGLLASGRLKCWGSNSNGQVGIVEITDEGRVVANISNVSQIDLGSFHTCAVKTDGSAWCWGRNHYGQLGVGTTVDRSLPTQVSGFTSGIAQITNQVNVTCALKSDGSAWCWGYNGSGAIGDGTTTNRLVPTQVSGFTSGIAQISSSDNHVCAVKTDGSAWCWGANDFGYLGDGTTINRLIPTQVSGFSSGVSQISGGSYHTCAVKTNGSAWCWGYNLMGQLGDGTIVDKLIPTQVIGLTSGISQITGGLYHTCVMKPSGTAWCWGQNSNGQLGDGTVFQRLFPVQVLFENDPAL